MTRDRMAATGSERRIGTDPAEKPDAPAGLYVHVPFCSSFCSYCDFYSELKDAGAIAAYLAALERELALVCPDRWRPATVYFGGGTPSVLLPGEIEALFLIVRRAAALDGVEEMTFEGNPESLDGRKLRLLVSVGVTRISIGVQSFDPAVLRALGRRHGLLEVRRALEAARAAGFRNIGLDLIYGAPGQTRAGFMTDIGLALDLKPDHISVYGLTIEDGTPLAEAVAAGSAKLPSEEEQRGMYLGASEVLEDAGLAQYEISNFARPGCECRHNLAYWRRESFIGIGPSAVSFVRGERRRNAADLAEYCRAVSGGRLPIIERECLAGERAAREEAILRLRTREGLDMDEFRRRTGLDLAAVHGDTIRAWVVMGLARTEGSRLSLTRTGFCVANSLLAELV
ncbi:MAG: radical SAM family heme chaperone HemW [Planctomycetota bacterium]|nr:radical SAM family heme chaperone HemW [Planctomycetota bacterium]